MYTENALFFPKTAIASLQKLRGAQWEALVERVTSLPETHEETLALMLLMIQLNGCLTCETDSYRAMRGCCACAQQTLRRFKGSDDELLELYDSALRQVQTFAQRTIPVAQLIQVRGDFVPLTAL
ncbi:MAG: hypothetical protein H7Y11_00215 [Armatimonadetes bacterium]|nr:hypothetical protein [Anaerolineae bacterium]